MEMPERDKAQTQELHLHHLWGYRRMWISLLRCLTVAAFMAAGFGGLAFLSDSNHVSQSIVTQQQTAEYAQRVAAWCMLPMVFIALQVEFQLMFVLSLKHSWPLCQKIFPVLGGIVGLALAAYLFSQPEHGPKQTMLLVGGALVLSMGVSLQLALLSTIPEFRTFSQDFPMLWYSYVILMLATFLGAWHGWTDRHPQLKQLLQYQEKQWVETPVEKLPTPEADELQIY